MANNHALYIGRWAETIGHVLLMISLYEMGAGILYGVAVGNGTIAPGTKTFLRGIGRYAFLSLSAIILVLSVAVFGLNETFFASRFRGASTANIQTVSLNMRRLYGAEQILLFVISLGLITLAAFALHTARKVRQYSSVSPPHKP
jgi:hypothetical protein